MKYRTLRIGMASVFFSVAVPIGTALSGILFQQLGFYGIYSIAVVLHTLTIWYGIVFIKETNVETKVESSKEPPPGTTSCLYFFKDFFRLNNIKEAFAVTFKKGQHNRQMRIIFLMIVVFVVMGPLHGS